jgi:magnesium-transporting ATPase (P-type)
MRAHGIDVAMLTGDNKGTAERIAKSLGIDIVFADVLPGEKASKVKELHPSEQEYNTGDPPHRQFAPKLESETCYGGADSRGQSLATLGWREGFVCRTYGWLESDWRYFARYSPRQ